MRDNINITSNKYLFKLTWPIFLESLLQMFVGNIDQIMLGRYSDTAVAAVGNANSILNVLILTFSIISLSTTVVSSQYIGANQREKLSQVYTLSLFVNLIASVAVCLVLVIFSGNIFKIIQLPEALVADSRTYIVITGLFMPAQAIFLTFSAIFRSNALMRDSMIVSIMMNIINIFGNALLIDGVGPIPAMGVAGVAIATVLSRLVATIVMFILFKKRIQESNISIKHINPFPKAMFKKLILIGAPSGGEALSYNLSQMLCLTFINILGTNMVTTKVYASMFAWLAFLFAAAISQSSQIVLGYLIGSGSYDLADIQVKKTLNLAVPISFLISILIFLSSDFLFGLFTTNEEIIRIGKYVMGIEIVLEVGRAFNLVLVRSLQVVGDVNYPTIVALCTQWIFSVIIGYIFGIVLGFGLPGIWVGMALDEFLRGFILLVRWNRGKWRAQTIELE